MTKHVLVTGAAGSLGEAVCSSLTKVKGVVVYGTDVNHGHFIKEHDRFDLRDIHKFRALYNEIGFDAVIHCAASIYGVAGFNDKPADIIGDDTVMTYNILSTIDPKKTKMVYLSSSMVYESCPVSSKTPFKEDIVDDWSAPKTEYGLSKYVGERMVKAHAKQNGLDYTIWRPFNIITPFERPKGDKKSLGYSHVFADFFENILIKKLHPVPIIGDGNQVRCFTWFGEVADVIAKNVFNDITSEMTFNIGNDEPVTMIELAEMIADESVKRGHLPLDHKLVLQTERTINADVRWRVPSVALIKEFLGWEAKVKTRESIVNCMDEWETLI